MIFFTFGKLTLGTMTLCKALGASFGGFLGSPPGWYLSTASVLLVQGSDWSSILVFEMLSSFIALGAVGLPWQAAWDNANFRLGSGRCRFAAWNIVN